MDQPESAAKALEDPEIDSTAYVCNGADGATTLIRLDEELPGDNCALGGTAVFTGIDEDDDGVLSNAEVLATAYVCDSSDVLLVTFDQLLLSEDPTAQSLGLYVDADETAIAGALTSVITDGTSGALYIWDRDVSGDWSSPTKLTPPGGLGSISFGDGNLSMSQGTVVVGAPNEQVSGQYVGAAYVFTRDASGAWSRTQRLAPSDGPNGGFGRSAAVDGSYMAIGLPSRGDRGEVHVFRRAASGTWIEETQLDAPDGASGDALGSAVAISGTTILAHAPGDDDVGTNLGSVYVFDRNPSTGLWSMSQKLMPPVPGQASPLYQFGRYLDIDGDRCAIASIADSENGTEAGAVFVYERVTGTGWTQRAKLMPHDAVPSTWFGSGVAIQGDVVVAGVVNDHDLGANSGSAYVFRRHPSTGDWVEHQKLHAPDGKAGDYFGEIGVAIGGETIAVGAPGKDVGAAESEGAIYTFENP